jgi:hypothetical protein
VGGVVRGDFIFVLAVAALGLLPMILGQIALFVGIGVLRAIRKE